MKTNVGNGVALKGIIIDLNASFGGHEHALFDRRTGVGAPVAPGATIGYSQKMFFHISSVM
jgi:hypothetical protein